MKVSSQLNDDFLYSQFLAPYVDDSGALVRLASGMCFTVEPGLYFRSQKLFEKYSGIGIRIEDDVVVTATGCELLSTAPKEIEEVENLRSQVKRTEKINNPC